MQLYNRKRRKPRWKVLRTSNVKTQAHADVGKLGIREGIGRDAHVGLNKMDWMSYRNIGDGLTFKK
jgi:hypothetical protein